MAKKPAATTARKVMATDSLKNLVTGLGGNGDKLTGTLWTGTILDRGQLDTAYRHDWLARKVIDIPAADATRAWRNWQADGSDITKIEALEAGFNVQKKLQAAMIRARLYGGGALVMGIDDGQDPSREVDIKKLKPGALKFIHAVPRHEITAGQVVRDIMSPFYGEPEYYQATGGTVQRFHPSRVVRLVGNELPTIDIGDGWGDPVLQSIGDAIKMVGVVVSGAAQMINEAKLDVIKIPHLTEMVADPVFRDKILKRFGLANAAKSIYSMLLLDKEEEWQRIQTNFASVPDLLKLYLLMASAAADIPATRLMGQSPQGLSATGDSDTRNYYDRISAEQKTVLGPALQRLDEVLIRCALGDRPADIFYNWNSLWQIDPAQKAETDLKKAQAFQVDVNSGAIDGEILREARINQLIEDGVYPGLESIVQDFQAMAPADPEVGDPQGSGDPTDPVDPIDLAAERARKALSA